MMADKLSNPLPLPSNELTTSNQAAVPLADGQPSYPPLTLPVSGCVGPLAGFMDFPLNEGGGDITRPLLLEPAQKEAD